MCNYEVGIVIPVYLTQFIGATIERLANTKMKTNVIYCIVNDGIEDVKDYLETIDLADNMYVLNLKENRCYAGSNNAGWRSLIDKYPELKYLGSLNDDTICYDDWLDQMMITLKKDDKIAAVAPNVLQVGDDNKLYYCHAVFEYGVDRDMVITKAKIDSDEYVNLIGGCCFITQREALEKVEFLDEYYKNFCEDVDLSLKFITNGYKMAICGKATIAHYFGPSRTTRSDHDDDIVEARRYLRSKWGEDLSKYN